MAPISIEMPPHLKLKPARTAKHACITTSFLTTVALTSLIISAVAVANAAALQHRIEFLEGGIIVTNSAKPPDTYELHGALSAGSGEWAPEPSMPFERSDLQAVACGGTIVLLGGISSDSRNATAAVAVVDATVSTYDPQLEIYDHGRSPMPTGRYRFGAACLDGKVYVAGGYASTAHGDAGECLGTVDIYDVAADVWASGPPLGVRRGDLGLAAVDGKIYAMGGYGYSYPNPDMAMMANEVLDPSAASPAWSAVASLPLGGRGDIMPVAIDDVIYLAGGWNGVFLDTLIAYTPSSDTWAERAKMRAPRGDKAQAAMHGHLYIIGGETWSGKKEGCPWDPAQLCDVNKVPVHSCEKYYPEHDAWIAFSPIPEARYRSAAAAARDAIHTFGGQGHGELAVNTAWSFRYPRTAAPGVFFHGKAPAQRVR